MLGGLAAALVSLPLSMTYGVVAFSALGADRVGTGLVAGIYGAVAVSLFAVLTGSRTLLASGPRAAAAVVFSSVVLAVLAQDRVAALGTAAEDVAIAFGFLTIALAGGLQVVVGVLRLGRVVRYMPAPVIAGFVNASALIIIIGQLPVVLGLPRGFSTEALNALPGQLFTASTLSGIVTILLMHYAQRLTRAVPTPLLALLGGTLLYHTLTTLAPEAGGSTLAPIAAGAPQLFLAPSVLAHVDGAMLRDALAVVVPAAFSMMALASFETLLSLTALDDREGSRSAPDRELFSQGVGNVAAALLGGMMGSGGLNRTTPLLDAGARKVSAHVVSAMVMVLIVSVSYPLVRFVPQAVVAGMIIYLGWSLIDRWSIDLIRSLVRQETHGRGARLIDALIIVLVVGVALQRGIMAAVGVGVLLAVFVFVTSMSRTVVRSVRRGPGIHSRRSWSPERQAVLAGSAQGIAVVELDGVLFFGTAHGLETHIDRLLQDDVGWLILDFRRVRDVDTSGARALLRIRERALRAGSTLVVSCIRQERRYGAGTAVTPERRCRHDPRRSWTLFEDAGVVAAVGATLFFDDTDAALAHCESALIDTIEFGRSQRRSVLRQSVILRGLDRDDFRALRPRLEKVHFQADEIVFRQGEAGDAVYLVMVGRADIFIDVRGSGVQSVVHSVRPGSVFGEMAVLDGQPRAAGVRAVEPLTCYRLGVKDFLALQQEQPRAALKFYKNLCLVFSERLRAANGMIAELEA